MLNPSLRFVILITNRIVINEKYRGEAVTNSNDGFNTRDLNYYNSICNHYNSITNNYNYICNLSVKPIIKLQIEL